MQLFNPTFLLACFALSFLLMAPSAMAKDSAVDIESIGSASASKASKSGNVGDVGEAIALLNAIKVDNAVYAAAGNFWARLNLNTEDPLTPARIGELVEENPALEAVFKAVRQVNILGEDVNLDISHYKAMLHNTVGKLPPEQAIRELQTMVDLYWRNSSLWDELFKLSCPPPPPAPLGTRNLHLPPAPAPM